MVSAVNSRDHADLSRRLCYPGGGISVGADIGWIPRGALSSCTPSTRTYGRYVGMVAGLRVPSSSCAPLRAWSFFQHPLRAAHGGTAAMACLTKKVANIIGESTRIGVRPR